MSDVTFLKNGARPIPISQLPKADLFTFAFLASLIWAMFGQGAQRSNFYFQVLFATKICVSNGNVWVSLEPPPRKATRKATLKKTTKEGFTLHRRHGTKISDSQILTSLVV